jgi:tetratricopeptide (TPR) repeat protein
MTDFSSIAIPKPLNWQDFERNCRVLFEHVLGDPNTQLNGRAGQPQSGVDIWGRRGGQDTRWVGIQCKGKSDDYHGGVTEAELRGEVRKSRTFIPALSEFIIVTTAPDDAAIQKVARVVTQENEDSGSPMEVNVWGWGTLQSRISLYPNALEVFCPDITPFTKKTLAGIDELKSGISELVTVQGQIMEIVSQKFAVRNTSTEVTEKIDQYLHREVDDYRDLIRGGRPQTAIDLLDKLRKRSWDEASPRVRFRIVTNIGAAKLMLGDEKGAATDFLTAQEYDATDKIGMANAALAYMIMDRTAEAAAAAELALRHDPMNENAASYLIQSRSSDSSVTDPLNLVSQELRDTPAVRMGVISFFRRRRHPDWRKAALEAVSLFPDVDELRRAAAEASLDAILEARWFLLGERTSAANGINKLREAANTLDYTVVAYSNPPYSLPISCNPMGVAPLPALRYAEIFDLCASHQEPQAPYGRYGQRLWHGHPFSFLCFLSRAFTDFNDSLGSLALPLFFHLTLPPISDTIVRGTTPNTTWRNL